MLCGAAVSVLLFLLWSLVEVHSQTAPYLTFMGETLPDHSYVDLSALGELDNVDDHVVCHTDLTSCCGGDDFYDRGFWFFPNGTVLRGARRYGGPGAATNPIVLMRGLQLVRLIVEMVLVMYHLVSTAVSLRQLQTMIMEVLALIMVLERHFMWECTALEVCTVYTTDYMCSRQV